MSIRGITSEFLETVPGDAPSAGRLRYLQGGEGPPVVLLHTVRTQAEHFHRLVPLLVPHCTVYALDLPGMGWSQIVPGASYDEPAMRAAVQRFVHGLDLHDVTLVGESYGAVLALTVAATVPDRITRVVAINPYDYSGGIKRSSLLARVVVSGVLAPVIGPTMAKVEPAPAMRAVLHGGLVDESALTAEYLDELLAVGKRPGYSTVARAVYGALPSLIAARALYSRVSVPVDLVYGRRDWSRAADRESNRQLLSAARHHEIVDGGHFLVLEKPAAIAELVV